jgi:hypothetical protein
MLRDVEASSYCEKRFLPVMVHLGLMKSNPNAPSPAKIAPHNMNLPQNFKAKSEDLLGDPRSFVFAFVPEQTLNDYLNFAETREQKQW